MKKPTPEPSIWQGIKLSYSRLPFLGRKIGGEVVATCNAFLNLEIEPAGAGEILITKDKAILRMSPVSSTNSASGGGGWRGLYNPSADYVLGDVVMVPPEHAFAVDGTIIPGIYVCNIAAATKHPKHERQSDYDQSQWVCMRTWSNIIQACNNANNPPTRYNFIVDGQVEGPA